ncbi:MAG TPA: hypothetical protein VF677_01175 [Flavobacterium sp.]
MNFNKKNILLFIIILFNAGVFIMYGVSKIMRIQAIATLPEDGLLATEMQPTQVMWYFLGIKAEYAILVGLSQIGSSVLLLFKRTRLFGAIVYFFVVSNILAINVIFRVTWQTLLLSIILFMNILIIIYTEKDKVRKLFS